MPGAGATEPAVGSLPALQTLRDYGYGPAGERDTSRRGSWAELSAALVLSLIHNCGTK